MTDRHVGDDDLLALALGDVDDERRDSFARHLAGCERCRAEYAATADAVEHVLLAAPRVAPPPGFSGSTLAAMGLGGLTERTARRRRWARPARLAGLAAAAVAGVLVGVGATVAVLDSPDAAQVAQVAPTGPAIVTGTGVRVGTVLESWHAGEPVLVVALSDGPVGQRYTCVLVHADGTREPAGSWVLEDPGGATWVLGRPATDLAGLDLVTDAGTTWAAATW